MSAPGTVRGVTEPSITCPRCGRTSHHRVDVAEGYCGACHDWTAERTPAGALPGGILVETDPNLPRDQVQIISPGGPRERRP